MAETPAQQSPIAPVDRWAGVSDTQKAAAEQTEAVSRLELQAEQAIASIPPSYAGRSSLISDIQGAIANARAAARSGQAIDLSALKQLIDKAQEAGKETTQRQTSQGYLDSQIVLDVEAQRRIDIASRTLTNENLREYIDSVIDPDNEMDAATRKRIADAVEEGIKTSPDAQAQLAIRAHFSETTLQTASTMQEAARTDVKKMAEQATTPEEQAVVQRASNSEIHTSREGMELIGQRKAGEISTSEFNEGISQIEEKRATIANPYRDQIFNALPADRQQVLARMGLGTSAEDLNLVELMHRNGTMPSAKADFKMLREKGFENLPPDVQERITVRETAKHVLLYSGLHEFNELALFVAKSKEHEQSLTADEKALIANFEKITDPNTPAAERENLAIAMYKDKHPELFRSVANSPEFQKNAAAAILKTFDENRDKFGVENNPHLTALEKAASDNVTERFLIAAGSALDGAMAIISGDAEKAKEFASEFGAAVGSEDVGKFLSDTGVTLSGLFSSTPTFGADIQQQLAGVDLSALKDADGKAMVTKDAEGKVDMDALKQTLENHGISLSDVDADKSGEINGNELLTALAKQRQQGDAKTIG